MVENSNTEVERFVQQVLQKQRSILSRERRSHARVPFVYPVTVQLVGRDDWMECVSLNISGAGICLIGKDQVPEGSTARVRIPYQPGRTSSVRSECRWSRDYAAGWFISGWRFFHLLRE